MTADILYYYMLRNCSRMMATSQANAAVSLCLSLSLLFCGCNIIYVLLICSFLGYSPVSGHFTPPRLPYCAFYQTSWQLLTVEILQHRSCWTYLLRSTRLTTTFCCRGYRQASALAMLPSTGSANSIWRTLPVVVAWSFFASCGRPTFLSLSPLHTVAHCPAHIKRVCSVCEGSQRPWWWIPARSDTLPAAWSQSLMISATPCFMHWMKFSE